jgi:hypothetical protein
MPSADPSLYSSFLRSQLQGVLCRLVEHARPEGPRNRAYPRVAAGRTL